MAHRSGRHFLQIPGPSNVPDRILRAIDMPTIDHRGPEFGELGRTVLAGLREVFGTAGDVVVFPSSGTGAWEAAIVNTLRPGDQVLMYETGQFATLWRAMAGRLGLEVEFVPGDWRHGVDPADVERRLREDQGQAIKAVMVVHNETSTGVTSRIAEIRAGDRPRRASRAVHGGHDLLARLRSSIKHDAWGVDVTVAGSQKGLMLPPGLGFNAISKKALAAAKAGGMPRSYWDWQEMLGPNATGYFPYTPATNLLYGLREALAMLQEEGLANVFARHARHAAATRAAVRAWGLEILAVDPREYSPVLTAVMMPEGHDADALRKVILEHFDMSLGAGLGKLKGKVFRIGHLGDFNDLMLMGTLSGVEMGLHLAGVPHRQGGVAAAMDVLAGRAAGGRAARGLTPLGDARLAQRLRRETEGEVLFGRADRGRYSTDASIYQQEPVGVLVPRTVDDVAAAIAIAREEGVPVLPRGGGTSQCGQTVNRALVLDCTKYLRGDPRGRPGGAHGLGRARAGAEPPQHRAEAARPVLPGGPQHQRPLHDRRHGGQQFLRLEEHPLRADGRQRAGDRRHPGRRHAAPVRASCRTISAPTCRRGSPS